MQGSPQHLSTPSTHDLLRTKKISKAMTMQQKRTYLSQLHLEPLRLYKKAKGSLTLG